VSLLAELSAPSLLAEARAQTGLSDFGDPAFRGGLGVLVETYETTANLSRRRSARAGAWSSSSRRGFASKRPGSATPRCARSRSAAPST
jgi:hypothetical protein